MDGHLLLLLMDDFEEFKELVPKPAMRLWLKKSTLKKKPLPTWTIRR